jgi:hypothetical protein
MQGSHQEGSAGEMMMTMYRSAVPPLYLAMLAVHVAHVFEEIWAEFRVVEILGLGGFLIANWVLWCIPAAIFLFMLRGHQWAYQLGIAYAAIMVANGIGHNLMTLLTGQYFGGFAGGFTGIGLIVDGIILIMALQREKPIA